MKKLVLPVTILAMSILPILTALTSTEKARRQSPSEPQREVVDPSTVCTLTEGFDNVGNLVGIGWFMQNNSMPLGGTGWFQGNPTMFTSQSGAPNSYVAADFNNGSGVATLSNWLLTPTLQLQNGGVLTFWTRTTTPGAQLFPDRLQVRMSTNGASTDVGTTATSVGDFTTLLLDINPTYADNYPHNWTQFAVTITGVPSPTTGRLAFRYFVENGGPSGTRSDYIGIDTMTYACPTPTPTPTPTPGPTPTLGNYPDISIALSTDATVTPDASPTNTTSINVSTSTNFKGTLEASPVTGVVRITNANPAGTYTVTVKAFNNGGTSATKTFTLTITTPATCNPVSFAAAANFSVGNDPRSVAVGDFNCDGHQDLAEVNDGTEPNYSDSSVSILLGNGDGTFQSAVNYSVGSRPVAVAVGDFNGDGNQDLAVGNYGAGPNYDGSGISILIGHGDGTFTLTTTLGAGNSIYSSAAGDFNGDGRPDLVVAISSDLWVFLGDSAGDFSDPIISAGAGISGIKVGDFNGDGRQDVVGIAGINTVGVSLGDGTGSFGPRTTYPAGFYPPGSLVVGDFNGDGQQDLAVTHFNANSHEVSILLGDGAGHFSFPSSFSTGAGGNSFSVAIADFNSDGNQDIATANIQGGNISVLLGDGTGSFDAPLNFGAGNPLEALAVGDFNGDGRQDIAATKSGTSGTGNVSIFLRDCALTPTNIVSRMLHGSAGNFDVNLPLTGNPGIECRTTGRTTNDYTIIVTFGGAITVNGDPQAQVTLGTGCVGSAGACSPHGTVTINGNTVTIPLTNVTNAQTINVTLFQVNGRINLVIPMGVLGGDVNGNGSVNSSDVASSKARIGQPVDATNFRADVNVNGVINATDLSLVKSNLGSGLP